MEIEEYIHQQKELYFLILTLIEDPCDDENNFENYINFHKSQDFIKDHEEFKHELLLISNISRNHHRNPSFFNKIFKILDYLFKDNKGTITNHELFNIFKRNKPILLYLIENKIILLDDIIIRYIKFSYEAIESDLFQFFLPEIKKYEEENENKTQKIEDNINFEDNRKIGENDSYISTLIRNDSVEEFITYVNKINLPLSDTKIAKSIFETNPLLIENDTTLIEYAAFFGSIQIFQYLRLNGVELGHSLWLYAIHSNNADMIHLLEEFNVQPQDDTYCGCLVESIKCHHNSISNYIEDNLLVSNLNEYLKEKIFSASLCYSNYNHFPDNFDKYSVFYYLNRYNYSKLVNFYVEIKKREIENIRISKIFYF
ncbi:hypothetical protein M9Y10_015566 [Tritrichomonas musculus]|uniref:DUF3447 domain-containing protein n=1 Tax=Tritrichomonas musculus TaxID=1915356 RepID=A0ABR2L5V1_9EUKA